MTTGINGVMNGRHCACPVIRRIKTIFAISANGDGTHAWNCGDITRIECTRDTINGKAHNRQWVIFLIHIAIIAQNVARSNRILNNGLGIWPHHTRVIYRVDNHGGRAYIRTATTIGNGVVKREGAVVVFVRGEGQAAI